MTTRIINILRKKCHDYGHRFTPWLMLTWKKRNIQYVSNEQNVQLERNAMIHLQQLKLLFGALDAKTKRESGHQVMKTCLGFNLNVKESSLSGAGDGVFVESGRIQKNNVAAMYPGTVYLPMDPIFFQSINNSFVLKCLDGLMIDGNHENLSGRIYKSCASRDQMGSHQACDITWLKRDHPDNPLAVGQIVNNAVNKDAMNVMYVELDIPCSFPLPFMKYLPNIRFRPAESVWDNTGDSVYVRTVLLIALRDIVEGEELFSSYFTEVGR